MPRMFVPKALLLVPLLVTLASALDPYITEPVPELAYSQLPKNFVTVLDPQGFRLISTTFNQRISICDLWWSKQIPASSSSHKAADVVYASLKPGTFLGLISIFSRREDFRHHILNPGLYTMRYAQPEQDGDDHAVSPYRDFVILSPAWVDKNPNADVSVEQLNKWGTLASHDDEPAVLSLVPPNPAYKKSPSPIADDRGFVAVQMQLHQQEKGKTVELPLSILIVRPRYENEGS